MQRSSLQVLLELVPENTAALQLWGGNNQNRVRLKRLRGIYALIEKKIGTIVLFKSSDHTVPLQQGQLFIFISRCHLF